MPQTRPPPLDLFDPAVREMIESAKSCGYVTYEALNAVLPSEITAEQIEDILGMLNELGIDVVEDREVDA